MEFSLDMLKDFSIHAITLPTFFDGEAEAISQLLDNDRLLIWVHLRKPGCSETEMRRLIESIDPSLRQGIILHDHLALATEYGLGGVQVNNRNPLVLEGFDGLTLRSCHSADEVAMYADKYDYLTLSPVYDSISKEGYQGCCGSYESTEIVRRYPGKIIALGGIAPCRFTALRRMGYAGAALLGFIWKDGAKVDRAIRQMTCAKFGYLQYITHGRDAEQISHAVSAVADGGCQWVQLRHKGELTPELQRYAFELSTDITPEHDIICIINDRIELAAECDADGVHLGKLDRSPRDARQILGRNSLIGATANSFEDILNAVNAGADYIGLGPFRFTDTKQNLSPVLGLEGYRSIMQKCSEHGITVPVVAIGGITFDDVQAIMATGVNGIAVSGLLTNAADPSKAATQLIHRILTNHN